MRLRRSRLWSRRAGGDDSGEELREDGGGEDVCAGGAGQSAMILVGEDDRIAGYKATIEDSHLLPSGVM